MVDIHAHLLPGLDDGPETLEESLAMLEIAAQSGTTDIVATPHANLEYDFEPELISRKLSELEAASPHKVRIHRGCDLHLAFELINDAIRNPSKYTINGKSYLLVEFSDLLIPKSIRDVFAEMVKAGLVPVITHPERNYLLHRRMEDLKGWLEEGCLIQVTALSLMGRFGPEARRFSIELLKRNMVHFVASDAHRSTDRSPRMDEAFRFVEKRFGRHTADRLFVSNPRAVLAGEPIEAGAILEAPKRKWFHLWS